MSSLEQPRPNSGADLLINFTPEQVDRYKLLKASYKDEPISTFPFTKDQLGEVVRMFSDDHLGFEIKRFIDKDAGCEFGGSKNLCKKTAVGSIDFSGRIANISEEGANISDSRLFCLEHIEDGFRKIELDFTSLSTDFHLGINGFSIDFLKEEFPQKADTKE